MFAPRGSKTADCTPARSSETEHRHHDALTVSPAAETPEGSLKVVIDGGWEVPRRLLCAPPLRLACTCRAGHRSQVLKLSMTRSARPKHRSAATIRAGFAPADGQNSCSRHGPQFPLAFVWVRCTEAAQGVVTKPLPRDRSYIRNNSFHRLEHVRWMRRNVVFPLALVPGSIAPAEVLYVPLRASG